MEAKFHDDSLNLKSKKDIFCQIFDDFVEVKCNQLINRIQNMKENERVIMIFENFLDLFKIFEHKPVVQQLLQRLSQLIYSHHEQMQLIFEEQANSVEMETPEKIRAIFRGFYKALYLNSQYSIFYSSAIKEQHQALIHGVKLLLKNLINNWLQKEVFQSNPLVFTNLCFNFTNHGNMIIDQIKESKNFMETSILVDQVLSKVEISLSQEVVDKYYKLKQETFANFELFFSVKQLLVTFNNFGLFLESFYFLQLIKVKEYKEITQMINVLLKGTFLLKFDNHQSLLNFKLKIEALVGSLEEQKQKLLFIQEKQEQYMKILKNICIFGEYKKWKDIIQDILAINNQIVNSKIEEQLTMIIENNVMSKVKELSEEIKSKKKYFELTLLEDRLVIKDDVNQRVEEFIEPLQENLSILQQKDFLFLNKEIQRIYAKTRDVDLVMVKLELQKHVQELGKTVNKDSPWRDIMEDLFLAQNLVKMQKVDEKLQCVLQIKQQMENLKKIPDFIIVEQLFFSQKRIKEQTLGSLNECLENVVYFLQSFILTQWSQAVNFAKSNEVRTLNQMLQLEEAEKLEQLIQFEEKADRFCNQIEKAREVYHFMEQTLVFEDNSYIYDQYLWESFQKQYQQFTKLRIQHEKKMFQEKVQEIYTEKIPKIDMLNKMFSQCHQHLQKKELNMFFYTLEELQRKREKFKDKNKNLILTIGNFKEDFNQYFSLEKKIDAFLGNNPHLQTFLDFQKQFQVFEAMKYEEIISNKAQILEFLSRYDKMSDQHPDLMMVLTNSITKIKSKLEDLSIIDKDSFQDFHWKELQKVIETKTCLKQIPFKEILDLEMPNYKTFVQQINQTASNEKKLKEQIDKVNFYLIQRELSFQEILKFKDLMFQIFFVQEFGEIQEELEEKEFVMININNALYIDRYREIVQQMMTRIQFLQELMESLKIAQQKFLQIFTLMNNPTFKKERQKESMKFMIQQQEFMKILNFLKEKKTLAKVYQANVLDKLNNFLSTIDQINKNLNDFLELKRILYPRLFFLGNDDMMELLGNIHYQETQDKLFKKIFPGFNTIINDPEKKCILGGKSKIDEEILFEKEVSLEQDSIQVLLQFEHQMKFSQQKQIENLSYFQKLAFEGLQIGNTQIFSLMNWIQFYHHISEKVPIQVVKDTILQNLNQISQITPHNKQMEFKKNLLIIDTIYMKNIVERLMIEGGINTFLFFSLLKYQFVLGTQKLINQQKEGVFAKIGNYTSKYEFEYFGNQQKLIYTPLTEKCFFIIGQALRNGMGGNPYGPAGTGKTETVKEIGRSLGNNVLVFNCDENINLSNIFNIFKGLVGSGAWGCFDEFNRLRFEQMTAISSVIQRIQFSLKSFFKQKEDVQIEIMKSKISVKESSGIFITLNPLSKEYQGRREIPECLKVLFRPISMTKPNIQKIMEVMLISQGFPPLESLKVSEMLERFSLSASSLFNENKLYDWGLRALKVLIMNAGKNLRKISLPTANDYYLCVHHSIENNFLSKMKKKDLSIFQEIFQIFDNQIKCIFQVNQKIDTNEKEGDSEEINQAFDNLKLDRNSDQNKKVNQLKYLTEQKLGVCVVGPSFSGKSSVIELYLNLLKIEGFKIHSITINPKIYTKKELYGALDENNSDFIDGIFVQFLRDSLYKIEENESSQNKEKLKFVVIFDGNVDPVWIEALNSTLDDNRLFTLPNGERFYLNEQYSIIIESEDLKCASPATISRLGIVYQNSFEQLQVTSNENIEFSDKNICLQKGIEDLVNQNESKSNFIVFQKNLKISSEKVENLSAVNFICNKNTTHEDLIQFIMNHTTEVKNEIQPNAQIPRLFIYIFYMEKIQRDQFGCLHLEQQILEIVQRGKLFDGKTHKKVKNIHFVIILDNHCKLAILNKRIKNRFIKIDHWQYGNELSIKIDTSNVFRQFLKSQIGQFKTQSLLNKIVYLCTNKDQGKQKKTLHKTFYQEAFKKYKEKYHIKSEKLLGIFSTIPFYQKRFEKLSVGLKESKTKNFILGFQQGTFVEESIEFIASSMDLRIFRFRTISKKFQRIHFIKEMHVLWNELKKSKVILLIDEQQLANEIFISLIDDMMNQERFQFFKKELNFNLSEEERQNSEEIINRIQKNLKTIIIWDINHEKELNQVFKNYSSFQRKFVSVLDEDLSTEDVSQLAQIFFEENKEIRALCEDLVKKHGVQKFMYFIHYFEQIKRVKQDQISEVKQKYTKGTEILEETNKHAKELELKITKEKQILEQNQSKISNQLDEITSSTQEVQQQTSKSKQISQKLEEEQKKILEKQLVIEEELNKVAPLIKQAKEDVKMLNKGNLDELRNYKYPHDIIIDIFTAIMKMLNEFDVSWSNMKKFLGRRTVIEQIVELDPREIKPQLIKEIEQLILKKKESFNFQSVMKISKAAAPIAQFVKAIVRYVNTVNEIKPLEDQLNQLSQNMQKQKQLYESTQLSIEGLVEKQNHLQNVLQKNTLEVATMKLKITKQQSLIEQVTSLLKNLQNENQRWQQSLNAMNQKEQQLNQYVCVLSYYMAFLSQKEEKFAIQLIKAFQEKHLNLRTPLDLQEFSQDFVLDFFIHRENEKSQIFTLNQLCGNYSQWPLIYYDPNEEILKTIKQNTQTQVLQYSDKKLFFKLDLALKLGHTVHICQVPKELDYYLMDLSNRKSEFLDGKQVINFCLTQTEFNPSFKMFFYTKDIKFNLKPQMQLVCNHPSIQNTQDNVLEHMIEWKNKELQEIQTKNIHLKREIKENMNELENDLLQKLQNQNPENILENEALISSLQELQIKNENLKKNLEIMEQTNQEIEMKKRDYFLISEKISTVIIRTSQMVKINPLYNFSIPQQIQVFIKIMESFSGNFQQSSFLEHFVNEHLGFIIKGLFVNDIVLYVLQIFSDVGIFDRHNKQMDFGNCFEEENNTNLFEVLFQNKRKLSKERQEAQLEFPSFIEENKYDLCKMLMKPFEKVINHILNNKDLSDIAQMTTQYSLIEKLVYLILCEPSKVNLHLQDYIKNKVDNKVLQKPVRIEEIFLEWSKYKSYPILIIQQKSLDLSLQIKNYCSSKKIDYYEFSEKERIIEDIKKVMSESQDKKEILICVSNLHYFPSISEEVIELYQKCKKTVFLMFITCVSSDLTPGFLDKCFKFTFEQVPNVYSSFKNNEIIIKNKQHTNVIATALSITHALIEERQNYVPHGWSKNYQFNHNDFQCVVDTLNLTMSNESEEMIMKIVNNYIYQGKVDRIQDQKILDVYFKNHVLKQSPNNSIKKENFNGIMPHIFGLDQSVFYANQVLQFEEICQKIKMLNNDLEVKIQQDHSREFLKSFSGHLSKINKKLVIENSEVFQFEETNLDILIMLNQEANTKMAKISRKLNELVSQIDLYLQDALKLEEIEFIDNILVNETPSFFLDIWGNEKNFSKYCSSLLKLKQKLVLNQTRGKSNTNLYDLQGMFNVLKFFEIFNLIHQKQNEAEEGCFFVYNENSISNLKTIHIEDIYIQGAFLDSQNMITVNKTVDKHEQSPKEQQKLQRLSIIQLNLSKVKSKFQNLVEIPLYYDSTREKFVRNLMFPFQGIKMEDLVLANPCLFIHK